MRRWIAVLAALFVPVAGCGSGDETAAGDGTTRTVLVDYQHDQFASAFLRYYPKNVKVRPGDTVEFEQAWTGEPHSVTMGKVVDDFLGVLVPAIEKYPEEEDAPPALVEQVDKLALKVPGMVGDDYEVFQTGAQPCYVDDVAQLPDYESGKPDPGCPAKGRAQPPFNGRQALYNSGFIPPDGDNADRFAVPIAEDTPPGTYRYFCNYHWAGMSGTVEVVPENEEIPSQAAVSRQARKEVEADAKVALQRVRDAAKGDTGDLEPPLAGRTADDEYAVIINEFVPERPTAKVGEKITWTFDGIAHTVSFNVPKYFPIFTVADDGKVTWNPKSYEPVGFEVPPPPGGTGGGDAPPARALDAGSWDGRGGFHSSGALNPGDKFSITFTRAGTYDFACVLHPQMVGKLRVTA
jgi:plastocyanin